MGNIAGYELNRIYNEDCLAAMRKMPDKCFDLAIVDPPYGINVTKMNLGNKRKKNYNQDKSWDNDVPSEEYFDELFRVSKNQIIWGGNYFKLPQSKSWIFWDKQVPVGVSFADGELAWTSLIDKNLRKAKIPYSGFIGCENKIHPTQKPVALYKWILQNYAKLGDKILDTHGGSCSSAIACHDLGFEYLIFEIDKDYFKTANQRVSAHKLQVNIFEKQEIAQSYKTINFLDN